MNRLPVGALCLGFLFSPLYAPGGELRPLYWSCAGGSCEPVTEAGRGGAGRVLLGYIKESAGPGTVPLHWGCAFLVHYECGRMALTAQPRYDASLLLGYIQTEPRAGTVPLYWSCRHRDASGECVELAPDNSGGDGRLLGYIYTGRSADEP